MAFSITLELRFPSLVCILPHRVHSISLLRIHERDEQQTAYQHWMPYRKHSTNPPRPPASGRVVDNGFKHVWLCDTQTTRNANNFHRINVILLCFFMTRHVHNTSQDKGITMRDVGRLSWKQCDPCPRV